MLGVQNVLGFDHECLTLIYRLEQVFGRGMGVSTQDRARCQAHRSLEQPRSFGHFIRAHKGNHDSLGAHQGQKLAESSCLLPTWFKFWNWVGGLRS